MVLNGLESARLRFGLLEGWSRVRGCIYRGVDQWRMLGSDSGFGGVLRIHTSPRGVLHAGMEWEGCGLEEGR